MKRIGNICPMCRTPSVTKVPDEEYAAWRGGMMIQAAMPSLTPMQRETLISGTCPKCWEVLFPKEEKV